MKLNTVRRITKIVASSIVGIGTAKIVRDVIANNVDTPEKFTEQVTVNAGAAVIGSMAVTKTKAHTDAKIDMFFDRWQNAGKNIPQPTEDAQK